VFDGMENVDAMSLVEVDNLFRPIEDVFMNSVSVDYLTREQLKEDFGFVIP
jgi:hypothetical protein